jgi:predicted aldo/keto reductase-like oxidoreductase
MKERVLGKTGDSVSRIGLGGIPLQRLTDEKAIDLIRDVLDLGVTFIDTANAYTNSEERIGKALVGRRHQVFLATKTSKRDKVGAAEHIDLSLRRLQTDYIDLYQLHNVASPQAMAQVFGPEGAYGALEEAKAAGKIRHIGVSSHSPVIAKELICSGHFDTIQFPFNFITREPGEDLLPLAMERHMGFIAMKPLDGGTLERVDLAFKYLLQFPGVFPDPGINDVRQMKQIISIAEGDLTLTPRDHADMENIRAEMGNRHCRRCQYCLPCPTGIKIPYVLTLPATLKRFSLERLFRPGNVEMISQAEKCIECSECEEKCPYRLPIREMLRESIMFYREQEKEWKQQGKST